MHVQIYTPEVTEGLCGRVPTKHYTVEVIDFYSNRGPCKHSEVHNMHR